MYLLRLKTDTTMLDFFSKEAWLEDSGLDISLPEKAQTWAQNTFGAGKILTSHSEGNRTATLKFCVRGETRQDILQTVSKLSSIVNAARERQLTGVGSRCELQYQWDGTSNITYFEVLDGDFSYPDFLWSIEGLHNKERVEISGGRMDLYCIHECELKLTISPYGYAVSPTNLQPIEVPLWNTKIESKTTGGIPVDMLTSVDSVNWVEVNRDDLIGDQPMATKLVFTNPTNNSYGVVRDTVHIGLKSGDFGFKNTYNKDDPKYILSGSITSSGDMQLSTLAGRASFLPNVAWQITGTSTRGRFMPFVFGSFFSGMLLGVGKADIIIAPTAFFKPVGHYVVFGALTLPPYANANNLNLDYAIGLLGISDPTAKYLVNRLHLLPVDDGYRRWNYQSNSYFYPLTITDDGWQGVLYNTVTKGAGGRTSDYTYLDYFGSIEPLKLLPNKTQRIYFANTGNNASAIYGATIQLFVVPTFTALAV